MLKLAFFAIIMHLPRLHLDSLWMWLLCFPWVSPDVSQLELYPRNQNEGEALDILQKGAQFCLWYHQLMLKMVMEVNDQICRRRLREFDAGIEAMSHASVGLSLDLHISAPSSAVLWICGHPWIPAGAGISQEMGRFSLSGAHSVIA